MEKIILELATCEANGIIKTAYNETLAKIVVEILANGKTYYMKMSEDNYTMYRFMLDLAKLKKESEIF